MSTEPNHDFFERMCLSAGVGLIATDREGIIRFWNPAADRLFGDSATSRIGQPLLSVVPQDRQALTERLLERVLERGEIKEFDFHQPGGDGHKLCLAVTLSPILDEQQKPQGVSVCVRDVTRGMDILREVAEAQRMLSLGTMAGAVAHHFNNLLGGVITTIDFAEAGGDPEMVRRALRTTAAALARANGLTRNLLSFAEGEHAGGPLRRADEAVREFADLHREEWDRRRIRLEEDLPALPDRVPVKPVQHVLEVLCANACEAMPDGGTLRLELRKEDDGELLIRVSDDGEGIPPKHLDRVFEPFFTTKQVPGRDLPSHVGLGLAVAHGVVRELGGRVRIDSTAGLGTACSIWLPLETECA